LEVEVRLDELNILDIGVKIGLVGAVFGDENDTYLCMFPDQEIADNQEVLDMDLEDWKKFLRQTDLLEVEVLTKTEDGKLAKAIMRKTQRLIEQRVSWKVFRRDNYTCRYCGKTGLPLTVDHLVLWEEGGPSIEENLVAACRKCNKTRGNMQYADWLNSQYYLKVSKGISNEQNKANILLVHELPKIPLKIHRRERK
jgi:hypothetical protein